MAVRKALEETIVVAGDRQAFLATARNAMNAAGFRGVTVNDALFQLSGTYRRATTVGRLELTLRPVADGTEVAMRATGNVDNLFALFRSPAQRILEAFKNQL